MVNIVAQVKTFECTYGVSLRRVLLKNHIDLYNSGLKVINRGIGTCGNCAVEVEGDSEATWRDKTHSFHSPTRNWRSSCQTQVLGSVWITEFDGF